MSIDQITIFSNNLIDRIISPVQINQSQISQIRDIELKIANGESVNLSEALGLMKIAQILRPHSDFSKSKVAQWKVELN